GNEDGIPDREQDNVASFRGLNGDMLTLAAPQGVRIRDISVEEAPTGLPVSLNFDRGFIRYTLEGVGADPVQVQLSVGGTSKISTYYSRGPEAGNAVPHVYDYTAALQKADGDLTTVTGNRVTLSFQDGGDGDSDGLKDGSIHTFGGPAVTGGGGSSAAP